MYLFIHSFIHSFIRPNVLKRFALKARYRKRFWNNCFVISFISRVIVCGWWNCSCKVCSLKFGCLQGFEGTGYTLRNWVSKLCHLSQSICCARFHGWNDQNVRGRVVHKEYNIRIFFRYPVTIFLKDWTERWIGRPGQISTPHGIPICIAFGQLTFGMLQYTQFSAFFF